VYVCVHSGECMRVYVSIYVCSVFLKKQHNCKMYEKNHGFNNNRQKIVLQFRVSHISVVMEVTVIFDQFFNQGGHGRAGHCGCGLCQCIDVDM
jgi:hypothetical protein